MDELFFDWKEIAKKARAAVAAGCVLLENNNQTLPMHKGDKVAVFGRSQFNYYKSGTGSGGCVNVPYVVGILDALKLREEAGDISIDKVVLEEYEKWVELNPFDEGEGWAAEPWNQKEMELDEEHVKEAAKRSDIAVIILGRTAGEDKDNRVADGSYMLTNIEDSMIRMVTAHFKRSVVVINAGNIIDMKWVEMYKPGAVMYAWQGGMEGGNGCVDVLMGDVNPSGRMSDTIARFMADYPAASNFGDDKKVVYAEDIYMGYRYFETFDKEAVMYPFGYGLSYTTFDVSCAGVISGEKDTAFNIEVKNTGDVAGATVAQLYISKPQCKLGKPARELVGFKKTAVLEPGESTTVAVKVPFEALSSYDDSGVTGHAYSYVVEEGDYSFYLGENVRDAKQIHTIYIAGTVCVTKLTQALAPVTEFKRLRPALSAEGFEKEYEDVPTRQYSLSERIKAARPVCDEYTGDKGIKLQDVYEGKENIDTFLAQLSDEDLVCMTRGEGMCSPKVTPGTASAFGGVTKNLKAFGIPVGCCADGPSGIRMDCGTLAFAMPNGTLLACTFDTELVEDLYELEGMDLRKNKIDFLLGPGINMHRHPLNGRNFEYFSEDPYLTGIMAVAQLNGMHKNGVSGTIKHFVGNEQEYRRHLIDSIISERALREIYLKPFEMAVKEGGAYSVMTSYGSVNGLWTAGSYDLVTTILRNEWKFSGIVMTDWWASINEEGGEASRNNTVPMVRAQNDLYMVVSDSETNTANDNSMEGLADGRITRGELVRNARNICNVLMNCACMKRLVNGETEKWIDKGLPEDAIEKIAWKKELEVEDEAVIDLSDMPTNKGVVTEIDITFTKRGYFTLTFELSSTASKLAQMPMSVYNGTGLLGTISISGTDGEIVTQSVELVAEVTLSANVKLKFGQTGMNVHSMKVTLDKLFTEK